MKFKIGDKVKIIRGVYIPSELEDIRNTICMISKICESSYIGTQYNINSDCGEYVWPESYFKKTKEEYA